MEIMGRELMKKFIALWPASYVLAPRLGQDDPVCNTAG